MSFRELLKRYEEGLLSEEEMKYVKEEIAKYEALEEYSAEKMSEEFLIGDQSREEGHYEKETIDLKRSVDHRLRKVIITSVLIAVGIWVGVFKVFSPFVDFLYYNPLKMSVGELDNDISFDVQAITELNKPGMNSSTVFVDRHGFGSYDVSYNYFDAFSKEFYDVNHRIVRGEIVSTHQDPVFMLDFFMNARYLGSSREASEQHNQKEMEYIKELNPASYGSFGILFEDDLTMVELSALEKKYGSIEFQWAAMRTGENDEELMDKIGINLMGSRITSALIGDEKIKEKYPAYSLMSWLTQPVGSEANAPLEATGYELHYKNLLEYVIDRRDNIELIEQRENKTIFYESALEYAKELGVKTYGVVIYGEMRDVIDFVESENPKLFDLTDALVTRRY